MKTSPLHQAKDTAFAIVLVLLLVGYFWSMPRFNVAAMIVLFVSMVWPGLFGPAARVWFGFSHIAGAVVSKVILTVIFLVVATPIGLLRRLLGKDSMQMGAWKGGTSSVFVERDKTFSASDLETPY